MPQVRNTAEHFVSRVIPDTKAVVRTRPLEALIIGSYVRGLSDRDIESLAEEAELGHVSKSTVSRICRELRDRYMAFCNRSLAGTTAWHFGTAGAQSSESSRLAKPRAQDRADHRDD